jgi:N-acetylglutamate synthase-like GNAT family acetyltransferase
MRTSALDVVTAQASPPVVRALEAKDLPGAERILRLAFGTFLGAPDPENFWRDRDYVYGRHRAPHVAAFGATLDGQLVGSVFATRWGSVGFLGPITVHPDRHEGGVGRALLDRTMAQFDEWQTRHAGLFTFAQSAKHVALYQKYGFYPRFLTAVMSRPVQSRQMPAGCSRFGELDDAQQQEAVRSSRTLTGALYPGLDLTEEIRDTHAQQVGDTVLVEGTDGIAAFAVCHFGPKSEAGADNCFIKFGAVREGASAERDYLRLLDACEALAAAVKLPNLLAGANMAREEAYRQLVARGFRAQIQGIAMHKDNDPGYSRPGVYIIDDWR